MFDYRQEIDGLRAIAVIAVVMYHAGFTTVFAGGYVGVDIFFVISGYLITSLIEHDYSNNRFSLIHFYERRCRRILPALVLVLFISSIFASYWMMNDQLKEYGQTLISIVCLSSNVFFWWKDDGYFSQITELNPLVHTWSLAVEEQFYFCFPLLYRYCRARQRLFHFVLFTCGLFSFFLCQWGGHFQMETNDRRLHWFSQHSFASFYLPLGRIWELLLGSFVALRLHCHSSTTWKYDNLGAIVGFVMLIISIVYLDSRSIPMFPNVYTLLPTVGSMLILLYANKDTWIGRCLSLRILRWVGLISYSVYLWHQPCLVFLRLQSVDTPSMTSIIVAVIVMFPLATLTYNCVEQPFRRKDSFTRKQIFCGSLLSGILTLIMGYYLIGVSNSRTMLVNSQNHTYLSDLQKYGNWQYVISRFDKLAKEKRFFVNDTSKVDKRLIIIGDSYARDFLNMVVEGKHLTNYDICTHLVDTRCQIYLGPEDRLQFVEEKYKQKCTNAYDIKYALPLIRQADVIILSSRWREWNAIRLPITLKFLNLTVRQKLFVIGPKHFGDVNPKLYINKTMAYRIKQRQLPESKAVLVNEMLKKLLNKSIFVDILERICGGFNRSCPLFTPDGKLISYDGPHLTKEGALYLGNLLFRKAPLNRL